jgi:hypothetical protein
VSRNSSTKTNSQVLALILHSEDDEQGVSRAARKSLRADSLERLEQAGEQRDRAALEMRSAAESHAQIGEYLRRTLDQ